ARNLERSDCEADADEEQDAARARELPPEDELLGGRALVLDVEERVGPRLQEGGAQARLRRVEALLAQVRAVRAQLEVRAPAAGALRRGGGHRPRAHPGHVLHPTDRTPPARER